MKKKLYHLFGYLGAFFLPILVVILAFAGRGIAPLGDHNLLVSDLATQYFPFFNFLRMQLHNGGFSTYSFLFSLGDNTIPVYTYYLMSPLNLLVAFVKSAQIPLLMEAIIMIKIGLISLSMVIFLRVKEHEFNWWQLVAGVAYGLCGFVSMYFYDFMWLEALMVLPFLTLAIDRLFQKGKWGWYTFTLLVAILLNYYMGYMLCVYSVIYFVYLLLLHQPQSMKFWAYVKTQGALLVKYIVSSILGGALSAILLVPTLVGMLSTGKGSLDWTSFLPIFRFLPSDLLSLGVGATNFVGRLNHEPSLFVGSFFALGILVFWFSPKIKRHEKRASAWLVGAIFVGMLIATFDTVWHMFQMPAGFPFREVYMLSFVMIWLGYQAWRRGAFAQFQVVKKAAGLLALLITIGYGSAFLEIRIARALHWATPFYVTSYWNWLWAMLFILLTVAAIGISQRQPRWWPLLLLVVSLEMGTNLWLALGGTHEYGNQTQFVQKYNRSAQLVKTDQNRHRFTRLDVNNQLYVHNFNINYNQYNDSLLFDFYGVNSYTSSLNVHTHDALTKLGLYSRNERRVSVRGLTPVTAQLLSVGRQVDISSAGKRQIKTTSTNAGLGYAVSDQLEHLRLANNDVYGNLNRLFQAESNSKTTVFHPNAVQLVQAQKKAGQYRYQVRVTAAKPGMQYLDLQRVSPNQKLQIQVNGQPIQSRYPQNGAELIELGHRKAHEQFTVQFMSNRKLNQRDLQTTFAIYQGQAVDRFSQATRPYQLHVNHPDRLAIHGNHFTGTVQTTKARPVVLISIPYDQGWTITDGNKPVKMKRAVNGLSQVRLTPGTHRLTFRYQTPGLKAGFLISLVGLIGTGLAGWFWRKKRTVRRDA
ncbi:YfhO family protein [Fructilactobacillus carniphilus]|uniref:YfhO family protein n=1 Tax=Fructilactobacillus carniphilus TaxID=2940297 RepID=A0ABY5BUZ7_9LACO|nr:YfhO family protein [Fructilactobacillus carniphilus]USS90322.1 YfhO family protein [Fructilactobacillus carniphilus]